MDAESPKRGGVSVNACPWFSLQERQWVLEKLYSTNLDEQGEALRQMNIWKTRSSPNVPSGIEVTYNIAKTIWTHEQNKRTRVMDNDCIQLMYGTSIIRFVNLVTECAQKADYPIPIHSIAQRMGIPEWIVDLRHCATHSVLPSLEVLEVAAKWAIEWLRVEYWESETKLCTSHIPLKSNNAKKDLFNFFLQIDAEITKFKHAPRTEETLQRKSEIVDLLKSVIEKSDSDELVSALLSEGLFFPSAQDAFLCPESSIFKSDTMDRRMSKWLRVIKFMAPLEAIFVLLTELFKIASRDGIKGYFASVWISFILLWLRDKLSINYGDHSQFCLRMVGAVSPLTINHLETLFQVFGGRRLSVRAVKRLISLGKLIAYRKSSLEMSSKVYSLCETGDNTTSVMENNEFSLWTNCSLGLTPSQLGSESLNLRLPNRMNDIVMPSSTEERLSGSNVDAHDDHQTFHLELTEAELNSLNLL